MMEGAEKKEQKRGNSSCGFIWLFMEVHSTPGMGIVLAMRLPIRGANMSESAKVLIVDDEELVRLNLRALLEDLGYRVVEAADGREGLDAFDRERPDLILADLRMPVMDGLSMIAGLREKSPETPVIVISGTAGVRNAVDSVRLGAWDYVVKPVEDAKWLEIVIERALEKARLLKENRLHREHLEELVRERTEELWKAHDELELSHRELERRIGERKQVRES